MVNSDLAILHANNLRDLEDDRRLGKRTLATILGREIANWEYYVLVGGTYVVLTVLIVLRMVPWTVLLVVMGKYVPQLLGIPIGYYYAFQGIAPTRWRLGKKKFLKFFLVMGVALRHRTLAHTACTASEITGVLYCGCSRPTERKKRPSRAIA